MNEQPHRTWIVVIVALISAAGIIIAAIISLGMPFAERIADRYYPTFTPIVNVNAPIESTPQLTQPTPVVQPTTSISQPPVINGCSAYVTRAQVNELKNIQGVSEALKQAQVFAGYLQIDFKTGDRIPAGVLIATDFLTTDIGQYNVIRINSSGGWGLFETTTEIQAPTPGTYRCISE